MSHENCSHEHVITKILKRIVKEDSWLYRLAQNRKFRSMIGMLNGIEGAAHMYSVFAASVIIITQFHTLALWPILLLVLGISIDVFFGVVSFYTTLCMEIDGEDKDAIWLVYDHEDGVQYIGKDYNKALAEYEACKEQNKDFAGTDGFYGNERVILAKVKKDFKAFNTKIPVEDEPGTTYWDFKETEY